MRLFVCVSVRCSLLQWGALQCPGLMAVYMFACACMRVCYTQTYTNTHTHIHAPLSLTPTKGASEGGRGLEGLAVCCSTPQCAAACCRLQRVAGCRSVARRGGGSCTSAKSVVHTRFHFRSPTYAPATTSSPNSAPQYAASHCNKLHHTATHCKILQQNTKGRHSLPLPRCHTLQRTATGGDTLPHTATHCNTPRHTAKYCNTLQHTAI